MDRDDLSRGSIGEFADQEFINLLQVFEDSDQVDSHHNCKLTELFEAKETSDGEVVYYLYSMHREKSDYYVYSGTDDTVTDDAGIEYEPNYGVDYELKKTILGAIQFFYDEDLWRGTAEQYNGRIDFDSDVLTLLYSEDEFQSLIEAVGTEYMKPKPRQLAITLEIPRDSDLEVVEETRDIAIELSRFFDSRISEETGAESFRRFADDAVN